MTFPAEPVNGLMISGMDAPGLEERAVHPKALLEDIRRIRPDYRIMSKAYIRAIRDNLKKAVHVFDHFHVVKLMNDKLSALRARSILRSSR